jgi:Family of unknown function (DUF5719)
MRSRGQLGWALLLVAVVAIGGTFLQREVGPKASASASSAAAPSGAWLCPHGGGPEWAVTLELANPGTTPVQVRVTRLSGRKPSAPDSFTVAPGMELMVHDAAEERNSASFIEYFGGWVAAGWVIHAGGGEKGVAAEPCLPRAAERWFVPDGLTTERQVAYLVIMNPFATDAIFTLTLYTQKRAPITAGAWTNVVLGPHRSRAFRLNAKALGEGAVSTLVDVEVGRVAAASLGLAELGGIRSSTGVADSPPQRTILPAGFAQEASTLVVMNATDGRPELQATLLSKEGSQTLGGLVQNTPNAGSAQPYPVTTEEPSALDVRSTPGSVVALRTLGVSADQGSTTGASAPAAAWVVLPSIAGAPAHPGLILTNPGDVPAVVKLSLLPSAPGTVPPPETVTIQPGRVVAGPKLFVTAKPFAAILVTAESGTVVPSAASYSLGQDGNATYAVSLGVPIPDAWIPS